MNPFEKPQKVLKLPAKIPNVFNKCFRFGRLKSLPPIVDNLFKEIPFSHEDKIHERIQGSLLLRRRTKVNFACCFGLFLQVFERANLQKISHFDGKE